MNYKAWDEYRGKIKTKKGGWRIGKKVESHGYDLMKDIVGHYSFMQLVILNATGRMPSKELADWVEAAYICLSWPDPRIWCNRIGALGGTVHAGVVASTCAGVLANDSRTYGTGTLKKGTDFINYAHKCISLDGLSVEEFLNEEIKRTKGKPDFMGFSRPIARGDERIEELERVTQELGFTIGPRLEIAYHIEKFLSNKYQEKMNMNAYMCAFLSDNGFTADEISRIFSMFVFSGVVACYTDASQRTPASFSVMTTKDIVYTGSSARHI